MRKQVAALLCVIVVGLMLAPGVSAGKRVVVTVPDRQGDVGKYNVYIIVGGANGVSSPAPTWGDEAPMMQVGYVDMVSEWMGKERNTYLWGMQLAADLPAPGDPLPPGERYLGWEVWIEFAPWTTTSGSTTLFQAYLEYHDGVYYAGVQDASTWSDTPIAFTIEGDRFQIEIPSAVIGNLDSFWWSGGIYVAKEHYAAWPWFTDLQDLGVRPDQVNTDFPWPSA